jgi:hypothetical protein
MDSRTGLRWGAATGIASIVCSAAAVMFEHGTVRATDAPSRIAAYYVDNQQALRIQALLFIIGSGFSLWFFPTLTHHLARAEGGRARIAVTALVCAITSVALTLIALTYQLGLAAAGPASGQPAVVGVMNAVFVVAGLPLAVMLTATALLTVRAQAFPAWLGWLAALAAITQMIPVLGVVADTGPLASGGWISAYLPYPLYAAWVLCAAVLLITGAPKTGQQTPTVDQPGDSVTVQGRTT